MKETSQHHLWTSSYLRILLQHQNATFYAAAGEIAHVSVKVGVPRFGKAKRSELRPFNR